MYCKSARIFLESTKCQMRHWSDMVPHWSKFLGTDPPCGGYSTEKTEVYFTFTSRRRPRRRYVSEPRLTHWVSVCRTTKPTRIPECFVHMLVTSFQSNSSNPSGTFSRTWLNLLTSVTVDLLKWTRQATTAY